MKFFYKIIDKLIEREWNRTITNASQAHFRAQELTRLQKIKESKK